jgi:acyl carrier protein
MDEMGKRLAECFLTVFPDLDIHSVASASAGSLPSWDSVATVTLLAVVEEEFGINVDTGDLASFDSFESILVFIRQSRPGLTTNSYDEDLAV